MERHLERLRRIEIDAVQCWLQPSRQVLEIGGGSGYQASVMASLGCEVLSVDLADRPAPHRLFYPVQDYDGRHLPVADASVDIVYSSNVLEHIQPLAPILGEIRRVLKPGGLAIHIVPSSAWRFWTSIAHYGYGVKRLLGPWQAKSGMVAPAAVERAIPRHGLAQVVHCVLPIYPHGEYPNAFAELYYFSQCRWLRVFENNGFAMIEATGSGLLYTGYELFPHLPLRIRRWIAPFLGSATHIFVMKVRGQKP